MKKKNKQVSAQVKKEIAVHAPDSILLAAGAAAIACITFLVFAPALNGTFTNWDDDTYVTANELVKAPTMAWKEIFTTPVALNYHPITMITLRWNYQAEGLHPHAYFTTNLFFHLLNSILVFLFFYFLSGKKLLTGVISGILFGIHPMHVESVAWISERKDVLYVFFFLLSLLAYLRYRENKKMLWLVFCFLLFVLSCLSKAMAVVLPVVLLLIDYFQQRKLTKAHWLEKIPFLATSLVFGVIALRIQSGSANETVQSFSFFQQFLFGCYGCIFYVIKFLFPVKLSAFYPYPIADGSQALPFLYYLSPIILLVAAWLVYRYLRKESFIVFGCLFFIATIVLVLQFISVGNAIMAERYSYLSYAGFCFIAGYGFEKLYQGNHKLRTLITVSIAVIMLCFGYLTHERTRVWSNSETLWSDVISKYPGASTAYKNRGNYYGEKGNSAAAIKDYDVLLSMNTRDPEVFNNLGNIYADQNKLQESLDAYSKAIALKPDYLNAHINRGISYNAMSQPDNALEDFSKAIDLNGQNSSLYAQRGYTYSTMGKSTEAVADFTSAINIQPDLA
ncbi:MAG: tetratricopeptide repeat protein, partial [Chitinophagales bacterium]